MNKTFPIRYYIGFLAGVGALFVTLLYLLPNTMTPLLIALILAYAFDPVIDFCESKGFSRFKAVFWFFLLTGFATLGLILFIIPNLILQLSQLIEALPSLLIKFLNYLAGLLHMETSDLKIKAMEFISQQYNTENFTKIAQLLRVSFSSTANWLSSLLGMLIIPLFFYYLLLDFDTLKRRIFQMIPNAWKPFVRIRLSKMDSILSGFLRGQLLVSGILSLLYSTGLMLLGVQYGLLIGCLSGLLNFVPYLGIALGLGLSLAVSLFNPDPLFHIIGILLLFGFVQLLEGFILTPRIIGNKVGLTPFFAILSLFVGGELFGIPGMLSAIPLAGVFRVIFRDFKAAYFKSRFFHATNQGE